MTRAAIYARQGVPGQPSIEQQVAVLRTIAADRGWTIVTEHIDHVLIGASRRERWPGFDAAKAELARREFDLLLVDSICRVPLSLPDLIRFISRLPTYGVDLMVRDCEVETPRLERTELFALVGVLVNKMQVEQRERIISGQERSRRVGTTFGRPRISQDKIEVARQMLKVAGIRATARAVGISPAAAWRLAHGGSSAER
jgi:DNA invertase Pin-like site-specific DNA recombinase